MVDPISSVQIANPPFFLFCHQNCDFVQKIMAQPQGMNHQYLYDNYRICDLLCQVCTCNSVLLINETSFGDS